MENSNPRSASELRLESRRRWLGRLILAAIVLVALTGAVLATIALTRTGRSAPSGFTW
jgi:hypothetical protein